MIKILEGIRNAWPTVWTVNCNRLSKIAPKASITRSASRRLGRASEWSSLYLLFVLVKETWNILECWTSSGSVATSSRRLVESSQIVSTAEIQLCVEIGEAWPSVRTVLLWHTDVFNAKAYRHCGESRRLHRNQLFWLGNCMESSWTSS